MNDYRRPTSPDDYADEIGEQAKAIAGRAWVIVDDLPTAARSLQAIALALVAIERRLEAIDTRLYVLDR